MIKEKTSGGLSTFCLINIKINEILQELNYLYVIIVRLCKPFNNKGNDSNNSPGKTKKFIK